MKTEEIVNLEIPSGASSGKVKFTPDPGFVYGCAIFTNSAPNAGFVNARITTDDGFEISAPSDIRNYRDRDGNYQDSKKPLFLETTGRTYVFEVFSDKPFTADFKAQLVFAYQRDFVNRNCN